MFCKNCGSQINEGQKFCPNCGMQVQQESNQNAGESQNSYQQAPVNSYQQPQYGEYHQEGAKSPKKKSNTTIIVVCVILGVAVIVAAAAGIFLGLKFFGKNSGKGSGLPFSQKESSYTDPLDSLMKGMEEQDGEILLDAFSDGTIEILEEQSGYSKEDIADMFEEIFISSMGDTNVKPGSYQVEYEIVNEEEITGSDLEEIQQEFDSVGLDEKIEEAKALELTLVVGMEVVTDDTFEEDMDLNVIKIDGNWYIDPTSMS